MAITSPSLLSDRDLLDKTRRVAALERRTTAELIALLAELDSRRLYLGLGYSSMFTFCTQALHLSESAAYARITAARAARRFPMLLGRLDDGDITLTTVSLLAAHLTDENHEVLLDAARHKSKRDVEELVACLHAQPVVPSLLRRVLTPTTQSSVPTASGMNERATAPGDDGQTLLEDRPVAIPRPHRSPVAPLGNDRYLLRITLTSEGRGHLDRARALLRHTIPTGDPAAIIERALAALVCELERTRLAATSRPRRALDLERTRGRRIPAAVKRVVWARDDGRCAFVGSDGRCTERGFLEFHHVRPFAAGGPATVDNLQLRCRAHNQYEANMYFATA